MCAQNAIEPVDSIPGTAPVVAPVDSIAPTDSTARKKDALEAPVTYTAADSIVMTAGNWACLVMGMCNISKSSYKLKT